LRLLVGIALVLGSVLLGARVLASADDRVTVWRAAQPLAAGTVIADGDLEPTGVRLDDADRYVPGSDPVVGQVVTRDIGAGELLARSAIDDVPPGTTLTIPVAALNAPAIRRGDRVAVWVSTGTCTAVPVLVDAAVQALADDRGGFSSASQIGVIVRVDPAAAQRVIRALDLPDAVIRVGVLEGPRGSTGPLPDLAPCADAD
jgi:hypothetical protein